MLSAHDPGPAVRVRDPRRSRASSRPPARSELTSSGLGNDLEDLAAQPEEGLPRCAGGRRLLADAAQIQSRRAQSSYGSIEVGGDRDDVVDGEHAVGVPAGEQLRLRRTGDARRQAVKVRRADPPQRPPDDPAAGAVPFQHHTDAPQRAAPVANLEAELLPPLWIVGGLSSSIVTAAIAPPIPPRPRSLPPGAAPARTLEQSGDEPDTAAQRPAANDRSGDLLLEPSDRRDGQHDRERRPALDPARPARVAVGPAVDGRRRRVALASLLLLAGSTADRFGRRRTFQVGLLPVRPSGSLLCSLAPTLGWLIAARMIQAVGGSMLNPVAMSIITNVFTDPRERARRDRRLGGRGRCQPCARASRRRRRSPRRSAGARSSGSTSRSAWRRSSLRPSSSPNRVPPAPAALTRSARCW